MTRPIAGSAPTPSRRRLPVRLVNWRRTDGCGGIAAWQAFDPRSVITRHGHYDNVSGVFAVSGAGRDSQHGIAGADALERDTAAGLCDVARANGIRCDIVALTGKHDWPYAGRALAAILPWLAAN